MKNYEETIQTVLERIHKKTAQKKRRRKTVIQTAVYWGCLCLVLLMGAGIWQSRLPDVPTDVTPTGVSSVEASFEQKEMDESDESKPNNPQAPKTETQEILSSDVVSAVKKPIGNVTGYLADERIEYPTFTDEETMQNWFKGNVPGYFTNDRAVTLQQSKNQKIVYYRPTELLTQAGELINIEYDRGWYVKYNYRTEAHCSITVLACLANHYDEFLQQDKEGYASGKIERLIHNEIEYYYFVNQKSRETSVHWQQFGYTHMATIYNYQGNPDEIIPLLKLEQVTVPLNSDHVTE